MIKVYTDGGSLKNGEDNSPASCAAVMFKYNEMNELLHWRCVGKKLIGSNNVAELTGAIVALQNLKTPFNDKVSIHSDSQYVIRGINEWVDGWKKRGWIGSTGAPVANRPLWEVILTFPIKKISWFHVKGHNGNAENLLADHVCTICMKSQIDLDLRGQGGTIEDIFEQLQGMYPQYKRRR